MTRKLTLEEIFWKVQDDGLTDCLLEYINADEIGDPEIAQLWREAAEAIRPLKKVLDEYDRSLDPLGFDNDDEDDIEWE